MERTQNRSKERARGSEVRGGSEDDEQLLGTTEDGVEVSGSLDDDEELSAGAEEGDEALEMDADGEADQSGTRGARGKPGGSGNFANDPDRAREAGRKGGRH